jgi:hypothetical protein
MVMPAPSSTQWAQQRRSLERNTGERLFVWQSLIARKVP